MMNSLESILNIMGNGSFNSNSKIKHLDRKNITRSNILVHDLKRIKSTHSFEGMINLSETFIQEMKDIDNITQHYVYSKGMEAQNTLMFEEKYGVEAASYYYHSVEEDGSGKNIFQKIWEGIKAIASKIAAFFLNLVRKIHYFITKIFSGKYSKFEKDFKAEDFINMDAEIKVVPLPSDIMNRMSKNPESYAPKGVDMSNIKSKVSQWLEKAWLTAKSFFQRGATYEVTMQKLKDLNKEIALPGSISSEMTKDSVSKQSELEAEINKHIFNSVKRPKTTKTTVKAYLNASPGQRPKLLELLSSKTIKSFENDLKFIRESTSSYKKVQKTIIDMAKRDKAKATTVEDRNVEDALIKSAKACIKQCNIISSTAYLIFMAKMAVVANVYRAVKAGCKKPKIKK